MALIKCPECGKAVADKASFCPSCGDPISMKELLRASVLLAETTKSSAELLAKTTHAAASHLAITTEKSANQISKSNDKAVRSMKWMTIALIMVGIIQIIVGIVTPFIDKLFK